MAGAWTTCPDEPRAFQYKKMRSSDNLVGSWIEIESSTEEEDSDAEVLE